jgi:hypothetical protein
LCGRKTWCLTVREEYRLRVFENFGLKGKGVVRYEKDKTLRRFTNCTSRQIYWADQIREAEMGYECSTHRRYRQHIQTFVKNPALGRSVGRYRHKSENNIITDLK